MTDPPENLHVGTARVAHLAEVTYFTLLGSLQEHREIGEEALSLDDAEMICELLLYVRLAASATHHLCAGDQAVA